MNRNIFIKSLHKTIEHPLTQEDFKLLPTKSKKEYVEALSQPELQSLTEKVVVLIHGVESSAQPMYQLRNLCYSPNLYEGDFPWPYVRIKIHNYRRFPFLIAGLPFKYSRNISKTYGDYFGTYLQYQRCKYPMADMSIIAHSWGTHHLGYVLMNFVELQFESIFTLGSVLSCKFPWERLYNFKKFKYMRNYVGVKDTMQFISSLPFTGMGGSGRWGFDYILPGAFENFYPKNEWEHNTYAKLENLFKIKEHLLDTIQ